MARTKEFDPEVALRRAVDLFWRRGYEATSITDLTEHLGIAKTSLYATFGSKHELYLAALDHYIRHPDPDQVELLARPGPVLPAVQTLLDTYARMAGPDDGRSGAEASRPPGCLLVAAAVECPASDADVHQRVERSWSVNESALSGALYRARAQGELRADADPVGLAGFLVVLLQGIQVVKRTPGGTRRALDAARHALDAAR